MLHTDILRHVFQLDPTFHDQFRKVLVDLKRHHVQKLLTQLQKAIREAQEKNMLLSTKD